MAHYAGCCFSAAVDCAATRTVLTDAGFYWTQEPYMYGSGQKFNTSTASECEAACVKSALCAFGTFVYEGAKAGQCWLAPRAHAQRQKCLKPCVAFKKTTDKRLHTSFGFSRATAPFLEVGSQNQVTTIRQCQHACKSTQGCIAGTFVLPVDDSTGPGKCWLSANMKRAHSVCRTPCISFTLQPKAEAEPQAGTKMGVDVDADAAHVNPGLDPEAQTETDVEPEPDSPMGAGADGAAGGTEALTYQYARKIDATGQAAAAAAARAKGTLGSAELGEQAPDDDQVIATGDSGSADPNADAGGYR
jgi:hypothetical protein